MPGLIQPLRLICGLKWQDIMDAIQRLEVYYSPHELQRWVADHDIVAVQERVEKQRTESPLMQRVR